MSTRITPARPELRTTSLDSYDGRWLWRSSWTGILYRRWPAQGWHMYIDGEWQPCYLNDGVRAYYGLYATYGEVFIRVGEVRG